MKTKTIKCIEENINYCLRGDTPIYETPTHLKYVLEMLSKEKQRKEQKKKRIASNERLAYANGIALGIATNYTLDEKKEIMQRARDKGIIFISTKPMEFIPLTDKTITVQETDKGTYIVTVKFNQPKAVK